MASFFVKLWESIFTPGPTPTILLATNVTFGALQTVLFALLLATYSVHFVVLSVLSASLWVAINWFAGELALVHQQQHDNDKDERDGQDEHEHEQDGDGEDAETTALQEQQQRAMQRLTATSRVGSAMAPPSQSSASTSTEDEWEKVVGAGDS